MFKIRIRLTVKIQELWKLKMEQWRAADAHSGFGFVEVQNGAEAGGSVNQWSQDSHHFHKEQNPYSDQRQNEKFGSGDLHQSKKRDPDTDLHQREKNPQHCMEPNPNTGKRKDKGQ